MAFEIKQKGNGRKLLSFLANQAQKYDYQKIGIEQTNEASTSFAKKYGFQNVLDEKCWIINVEDLKKELNSYTES